MMFWSLSAPRSREGVGQGAGGQVVAGNRLAAAAGNRPPDMEFLPDTSDWLGRNRLVQRRENDYLIDRESQKNDSYTGIAGIQQQDQAITESMGTIWDRSKEHLGSSDAMVVRTRQRLLTAARALRDEGQIPPGVDDPTVYRLRSGGIILPNGVNALEATQDLQRAFA